MDKNPGSIRALLEEGLAHQRAGRLEDALHCYARVLGVDPGNFPALHFAGLARLRQGALDQAASLLAAALSVNPGDADTLDFYCLAMRQLGRQAEALALLERLGCADGGALNQRILLLRELGRTEQAVAIADRLLAQDPAHAGGLYNRALAHQALGQTAQALADVESALVQKPELAELYYTRALLLEDRKDFAGALENYTATLARDPTHAHAFGGAANAVLRACDWAAMARLAKELPVRIAHARDILPPFTLLGYGIGEAEQLRATQTYLRHVLRDVTPLAAPPLRDRGKLRLAYLSADFHAHATAWLTAGVFEAHDRNDFEIIGISFGPDDNSAIRARLKAAFDQFHEVSGMDDGRIAQLLRDLKIDIAIDLKGHTRDSRPGILARRPAPLQLTWLGYPATIGDCGIDAVLADEVVLPLAAQPHYAERIVHLPGCYQPNDGARLVPLPPARHAVGLPEKVFVFCCFNASWKITEPVFEIWMRLLRQVDGSVLWLLDDNTGAKANLAAAARKLGVDSTRLIFTPHVAADVHLARHGCADLFLDTQPYGAHTGDSDALWAGLPVLTQRGTSFAGRVAASLLTALNLPELITDSDEAYEAVALRLANDSGTLEKLHNKLAAARDTSSLFDTVGFARKLECACRALWAERNASKPG